MNINSQSLEGVLIHSLFLGDDTTKQKDDYRNGHSKQRGLLELGILFYFPKYHSRSCTWHDANNSAVRSYYKYTVVNAAHLDYNDRIFCF